MSRVKGFVPLGLIVVSIALGFGYWFIQQSRFESFVYQVESTKVDQNRLIEPKDYLALKRDQINLQNTLNSSAFQLVSSLLFFVTAYTAWLNLVSSEKKQTAERFSKAVDQLGNAELGVRVGGIFSLEQIAKNSPEDHWIVMEVLTSYIRDQSLKGKTVFKPSVEEVQEEDEETNIEKFLKNIKAELAISVTTDIQAALTVISRRNNSQDPKDKAINLRFCDLRGANLRDAKLNNVDFRGAKISGADLEGANFENAQLQGTDFTLASLKNTCLKKAKLNHALLDSAYLEKAKFQGANLTNASFRSANLQGAKFNHSILDFVCFVGAKLQSTDLSQAKLKLTNLQDSVIDEKTRLDKKWKKVHEININGAKNQVLDEFDFSEAVLTNTDFEGASLKKAKFNGADLGGTIFKNACLDGCSFLKTDIGSKLEMVDFGGASLKEVIFSSANLCLANFKGIDRRTDLDEVTFEDVNLEGAIFHEASLSKATFIRSILKNVSFLLAGLHEATFDNCYFSAIVRTELGVYDAVGEQILVVGMGFNQSWV